MFLTSKTGAAVLLAACSLTATLSAAPRTESQALAAAQSFIQRMDRTVDSGRRAPVRHHLTAFDDDASQVTTPFYIFDINDGGFVIVSGSDHLRPIVAYSESDTFSEEAMPDNLQNWLTQLAEATRYAEQNPHQTLIASELATIADFTPIEPLLGAIAWDQNDPYSLLCPSMYPTGCMATALAQVMRYHRYPEHGRGSNSYSTANRTLSVDFSAATYDWDLMREVYDATATEAERSEVAKLMYHCGVALNMTYAADASGSTAPYYLAALVDYFGYNELTTLQYRNMYHYDEWNRMLYAELAAGRPILFSGIASSGGHAFVVDGYRSQGYYHVNWGWSGQFNGYYDISILNPTGVGAGAAVSDNGYSTEQSAVFQVSPTRLGRYYSPIAGEGTLSSTTKTTTVGGTMKIKMTDLTNYSPHDVSGQVYVLIEGNGQQWRQTVSDITVGASGINMITTNINTDLTLPADLTDGTYTLRPYFQPAGSDSTALLRFRISAEGYLNLTVSGTKVTVAKPAVDLQLAVSDWSAERFTVGQAARLSVSVTNNSDETYVGRLNLDLTSPYDIASAVSSDSILHIAPGETAVATFVTTFDIEGEWYASVSATLQNITGTASFTIKGSDTTFDVTTAQTALETLRPDASVLSPTVVVYNLMGQRVARVERSTQLTTTTLPAGIYVVEGRKVIIR